MYVMSFLINQMATLVRKIQCSKHLQLPKNEDEFYPADCRDLVVCQHLSNDKLNYPGNLLVRGGELFIALLDAWSRTKHDEHKDNPTEDVLALMAWAEEEQCHSLGKCRTRDVWECLTIS